MKKKIIKTAKVSEQAVKMEKQEAFKDDLGGYFVERDKTNRGVDGKGQDIQKESEAEIEVREMLYQASLKTKLPPEGFGLMFSSVLLTARRSKVKTTSGILIAQEGVSVDCDYQKIQEIVAIGPQIKNDKDGVRVGWEVAINFEHFRDFKAALSGSMADKVTKEKELKVPIINIDNTDYILMGDRDIKYITKKK